MDSQLKKNILWSIIALAAIALLGACGWFIFYKLQASHYKNTTYKFSLNYPKDWKVINEPAVGVAVVFQSPKETAMDVFQENMNVSVQDVPSHLASLKTFSDTIYRQMTVVFKEQIKVLENKDITFGQRPGHMFSFESPKPDALKSVIVWTIKRDRAYVLTFVGRMEKYEKLKPSIDEAISSFRLE